MDVVRTADFKIFIVTLSQSAAQQSILFTQTATARHRHSQFLPGKRQQCSREEGKERLSEPRIDQKNKTTLSGRLFLYKKVCITSVYLKCINIGLLSCSLSIPLILSWRQKRTIFPLHVFCITLQNIYSTTINIYHNW